MRSSLANQFGVAVSLIVLVGFAVFPMYWMIKTSLTPLEDVFEFPPRFFSSDWTIDAYSRLMDNATLLNFMKNSLIVSVLSALGSLIVATFAAYSFSKFRFSGRNSLMYLILAGQMIPEVLLLVALYLLFDSLGLIETYAALILSFATFTLPLCIFMLKSYFDNIPDDLLEAGRIDGASNFQIMTQIFLPLARPGLVAVGLFAFIRAWNDFIYALTLGGQTRMTLPPGLVLQFGGEFRSLWPDLMAASFVTALPVMICFMFLQKHFIEGLTAGAVKG
ncbi:carbohydrate ABC transporter permease [Aureimonas fodinaquatilis]|uniref:Carbohydrate ABC transporter permease n=2 Tax=Aureimonas fodinaquatilis TaxID=2565783 RepID=A0A5B0DWR4_9HYPH|nr:carbohydrate ABC transporter permease [Aureimonas fodinaquatilis]